MWKVEFTKKADKDFSKLTPEARKRIDKAIEEKLLINPDKHLIPLVGELNGFYKFRVGTYRLLCQKSGNVFIITVVRIGHRREIYN